MNYLIKRKKLLLSILVIAAPAILEMALNTMLMVADTMMISQLVSTDAVSAVGIVNSIFFLLIFVFSSFNTGAVALVSRSFGEKNIEKAERFAGNNLTMNLLIGAVISVIAFFTRDLLFQLYEITAEVRQLGIDYYTIIVFGMIFQFGSFAFASISRGVTDTKTPMYITGFVNIFNIVFNYLLIEGIWIFPEMGIKGAALATTLARATAFFIYVFIFTSGKHKIIINKTLMKLKKEYLVPLWNISFPGAIEQFFMQGSFFVMGIIITALDTTSEALFRILITIESTSFMPAVGISIATATLVGKALGEKDKHKATDTGYLATGMGIVWGFIAGLAFFFFPKPIISMFTDDQSLIDASTTVFFLLAFNQVFLNAYIVMSGALRGAGDTKAVTLITSARLWLIFVPFTYYLVENTSAGVASVWYAEITSFVLFLAVLVLRFHRGKWSRDIG